MITVAVLMPTIPSHAGFLPRAMADFVKQVFPADWDVDLHLDRDPKLTLGAKINNMVEQNPAHFYLLMDDDDLHSPTRLQRQIQPLIDNPSLTMTGTSVLVYRNTHGEVFRYSGTRATWIGGLAFPRSSWDGEKFPDKTAGCDTDWQKKFPLETRFDLTDESLMLCSIHPANSSSKRTIGKEWSQLSELPASLKELDA